MLKDFSKERFDIIIQGGQSNADGTGFGDADAPFENDGRIWYLKPDFTVSLACERVGGNNIAGDFSLAFSTKYIKAGLLAGGRNLLIIRAAVGGTGFSDKRWGPKDDLFLKLVEMIKTARGLNPENRFAAFIWHQGETDWGASFETHFVNLSVLLNAVRAETGNPKLPFAAGDFVPRWRDANTAGEEQPVRRAVREVCAQRQPAVFVDSEGLLSNAQKNGGDDTIHFCRDSLNVFGGRYFDALHKFL